MIEQASRPVASPTRSVKPVQAFDLVVIGGGTAGLTGAQVAASLGARVALVERHKLGGECLYTGCVPSKALLSVASEVHAARRAGKFGLGVHGAVDWNAVKARLREVIARIEPNDSPEALRSAGVTPIFGAARFVDAHRLHVAGHGADLSAKTFLVATGARPALPDIPGLADVTVLTNESVFDLPSLPEHLAVLGGGPVGCELAQAFRRLGSRVTLLEAEPYLLQGEEPEVSDVLRRALLDEEVDVRLSAKVEQVHRSERGVTLRLANAAVTASHVLVATGRTPNVGALGLEDVGVRFDAARGIVVNGGGRTTAPHVWAAGDVTGGPYFTHAAFEEGVLAALGSRGRVGRALASWRSGVKRPGVLPAVTFTDPEVARFGVTERVARREFGGGRVVVIDYDLSKLDRAVTDDRSGRLKLVFRKGVLGSPLGLTLLGAHAIGPRAGELVQLLAVTRFANVHPLRLALAPAPYPTYAEAVRWAVAGLFADSHLFGRKR